MDVIQIDGGSPAVEIVQVRTPDLGDHSYVIRVGDDAVVVDPQRDIERMERALGGARLLAVFETHIHNDYVTGGHLLAERHGAEYVLPAGSGAAVPHRPIADGGTFPIGHGWTMRAVHTPGHTPNHMSYELAGPDGPAAVCSGGSMLVGAVGRSDLLGPDLTEGLCRSQFRSVRHLADVLPDPAVVAPTHGAGSFCSASDVADTTSTVGAERDRNPALVEDDEDTFVRTQLAGYRLHPTYYRHMGPANLVGVDPIDTGPLPEVVPEELDGIDAEVVDLRPVADWADGHVPGSLCIPSREDFAQYVGWVLPWNRDLVLVGAPGEIDDARMRLARIGYDAVVGVVTDDLRAWRESGRELSDARVATFADLRSASPTFVLDVRDPLEVADGHLDGAAALHVSRVPTDALPGEPGDEVWIHCATGYRASIAAGFLERRGRRPVVVADDWDEHGRPLAGAAAAST
ncbi:MAG: MBL fold metallo-hydrolase [Acidimicrobiia bacterium]|nr:MBL fold metallo-hydrolase [Acidimicrobiia bacterium]